MSHETRAQVARTIQATASDDEDLDGAILTGWVAIAEWASPDGARWISRMAGNVNGDTPATWTVKGWLHDALDDMRSIVVVTEEDEDE